MKFVLSGHPRDPRYCPLNKGVRLVQVRFTEKKGRKLVFTEAGVRLIQGVPLIWGPLNTGFTEYKCYTFTTFVIQSEFVIIHAL